MWLLESSVRQAIERASQSGTLPTAEKQAEYLARQEALALESSSRVLTVAGETAEIEVKGILTPSPSFLAMLFGGGNTTYSEIVAAIAEAEANQAVTKIVLAIDSPGGAIAGLFGLLDAIQATEKPIETLGVNTVASAAYAIASKTDKIQALNRATQFGSVGIKATFSIDENEIEVTSTNAPKKAPDVTTEEGKAVVREHLDGIENLFIEAIAEGRGIDQQQIIADFGQGGMVLAEEALSRGMIDAVAGRPLTVVSSNADLTTARDGGQQPEAGKMDLNELKAQHPDVYQAAVQQGVEQERDRVCAHLKMGEASGDMKTAVQAVNEGSEMTATLQATYMTAGMNRSDIDARGEDNPEDIKPDANEESAEAGADVVALVEEKLGVGAEG